MDDDDFQYTISSDDEETETVTELAKAAVSKKKGSKNGTPSKSAKKEALKKNKRKATAGADDDSDDEGVNDGMDEEFDFSGSSAFDSGAYNSLDVEHTKGSGSWNFKSAIEILAKNDSANGHPERTRIDDLIKAERKEMLRKEAEEEALKKDEVGEDMVGEGDEASGSEDESSGSSESGSGGDDDDSDEESSDDEPDKADDDHMNLGLEEDNLRNTLNEDASESASLNTDADADEGEADAAGSDSESESGAEGEGSDEEEEDSDETNDSEEEAEEKALDAEALAERKKEAAFFDSEEIPNSSEIITFSQLTLSRPIMRGVAAIGFVSPTPIQAKCIPPALAGRDVVASAVTGSGKTAAFLLPILERIINRPRNPRASRALILTPTRELAAQCLSMMVSIARFTELTAILIVGGSKNVAAQASELRSRPDVIIATPGRLLDHVTNAQGFDLEDVEILVLDEADRLLEMGFVEEVTNIVKACPANRQTLLFSATFGTKVDALVSLSMKKPLRINVGRNTTGTAKTDVEIAPRLEQEFVRIRTGNEDNREAILLSLLTRTFKERVMVFFDTKLVAHRMMIVCGLCGLRCGELHGDLTQTQRLEALEAFKDGAIDVLLCTDLAARGLDINAVQTVLNFEMPSHVDTYVHRVGRTARAGCGGKACTLISEGRRHLMKDVIKDAEEKNKASAGNKNNMKKSKVDSGAMIRSRTVPLAVISHFQKKVAKLQPNIEDIMAAEQVAKLDRIAEMEMTKVHNILTHEKEIKARPKKEWFESEAEKKSAKELGREKEAALKKEITKMGDGAHNLTRKKKRRMEMRKEQEAYIEEARVEREENGTSMKKIITEKNMKAGAKAAKDRAKLKRDRDNSDMKSLHDEEKDHLANAKKNIKPAKQNSLGNSGLFDEEYIHHAKKSKDDGKEKKPVGGLKFVEVKTDKQGTLRKGGKQANKSFKSKAKHKRR